VSEAPKMSSLPPASSDFSCTTATFLSAPGRIRTCDRRIRSPLLCPLSYGRIRLIYAENLTPESSPKLRCQQYVSSSASKGIVHSVGQPAFHLLDHVGVGVEGYGDAGVPE
jgi:hypothetical protein